MSEFITEWVSHNIEDPFVREEIVRCRDCKYAEIDHSDHEYREPLWCGFHRMDVKPGNFCSWGVKRKEGGE